MARAGLRGLEFYDPVTGKHGQAHMQARYVITTYLERTFLPETIPLFCGSLGITQHLIEGGIAWLEEVRGAGGDLEDLFIRVRDSGSLWVRAILLCPHQVDREKVLSRGKEVVGKLLVDLQVRKSTADGPGARKFYTQLTTPLPGWDKDIRDVVFKKKTVSGLEPVLPSFETRYLRSCSPESFLSNQTLSYKVER